MRGLAGRPRKIPKSPQRWESRPSPSNASETKLTGEVEAHITRLACGDPPEGHARWTLALIAGKLVELQVVESISRPSVGKVFKKANSGRGA